MANQSAGNHREQQTWVVVAVLRSCGTARLLFVPTLQLPPFSTPSRVEKLCESGLPEQRRAL